MNIPREYRRIHQEMIGEEIDRRRAAGLYDDPGRGLTLAEIKHRYGISDEMLDEAGKRLAARRVEWDDTAD